MLSQSRCAFPNRAITGGFVVGSLLVSVLAQTETRTPGMPPTPATRQNVWHAIVADLHGRGRVGAELARPEDLDLPASLPALESFNLQVRSACWDEVPARAKFRLECGAPGQCLPFLVYLRSTDNTPNNARPAGVSADVGPALETCRTLSADRKPVRPLNQTRGRTTKPTLRPGDRATAVFLADNLRMSATVTCLDRGSEGEVIRVRNQNGQIFRARISGPAMLEALAQ
jgi:hypothetical protein